MNDLIQITTDVQGRSAVSARELYLFLEVKTEFAKWCKRMFDYGFRQDQDYALIIVKNDDNAGAGRPTTDYALQLDCAKEIAMLQRTDRGKAARLYFIQKEAQLRQVLTGLNSTEQV